MQHLSTRPSYPGLGLDLRTSFDDSSHYCTASQGSMDSMSQLLPVRELAMMSVMDKLTDKPDWHKKIFDDTIVAKWRKEAVAMPNDHFWKVVENDWYTSNIEIPEDIMDPEVFDYCVKELRGKARYYEKTGLIPTLDGDATVVKSDSCVKPDLHNAIQRAFQTLKNEQAARPDWHPNSDNKVMDLVHPSMYPLVYGHTRVLRDELVGVSDAIEQWVGKGEVIPQQEPKSQEEFNIAPYHDPTKADLWSSKYQWLPANVAFESNGTVRFTSYINNLHPAKHAEIYGVIEQLINTALPAWEQCLNPLELTDSHGYQYPKKGQGPGRTQGRFGYPQDPDDGNMENWIFLDPEAESRLANYIREDEDHSEWLGVEEELEEELGVKLDRRPRNPPVPEFSALDYSPSDRLRLAKRFAETGLQVIVKMASIELTPEKPDFPAGSWHVEGQMNEHICATALYYVDSENVTPSNLAFRMQTDSYLNDDITVGQDCFHWMESTYGVKLGCDGSPGLQNYGSVETKAGRLLAFPNVFQHRVSSFELADKSKSGHRSFIALWLVDPHRRIVSTANVPPQQMSWMADHALTTEDTEGGEALEGLPAELRVRALEAVREYFHLADDVRPMTLQEAEEHRIELMKGRTAISDRVGEEWESACYNFCEH